MRSYSKIFQRNPDKRKEMLELYRCGYSSKELGRIYDCDHTSILHWVHKYNVKQETTKELKKTTLLKKPTLGEQIKGVLQNKWQPTGEEKINKGHDYEWYLEQEKLKNMSKIERKIRGI